MHLDCKEIVDKVKDLLPMPEVSLAITHRMADDDCSISDIAEILQMDPVLSAKLIRIANSPFYSYPGKVEDLNRAVMLVGMNGLRELVWACESIQQFSRSGLAPQKLDQFWRHSLYTAMAAKTLAAKCKHGFAERLFLTGLLHDIGILVMFSAIPTQMNWVWDVAVQQGRSLHVCERKELGLDHYEVGAEFLKLWQLPESIVNVIRRQNTDMVSDDQDAALINIANHIAYSADFG
ncbi:MAG: HDOD domain-containing protein, partial [Gammaproteobacteria bacterium]|nr:HDOD domain-containing protein [Gammaproteobacteria bacterium]